MLKLIICQACSYFAERIKSALTIKLSISEIMISKCVQCNKMCRLIQLIKNALSWYDNFKKHKEKLSLNMVQKGAYLVG